jgi:hypothetical protein
MASRVRDKLLLKETRRGDVARVAELIRPGTDVNKLGKQGMIAQWERRRNREGARIDWLFTVERAREKLGHAYPTPTVKQRRRAAVAA